MKSIDDIAAALQGYDPQALSVEQVGKFLSQLVEPVAVQESQNVALFEALGRVLAQDVISPLSVPPHNNSAMDGFAFDASQCQADQALQLRVERNDHGVVLCRPGVDFSTARLGELDQTFE